MKKDSIWIYIKCDKCQEKIKIRINSDTDINDYILKKEILGNNCPNLMYAEVNFDTNYKIINADVSGGKLISEEEYASI